MLPEHKMIRNSLKPAEKRYQTKEKLRHSLRTYSKLFLDEIHLFSNAVAFYAF